MNFLDKIDKVKESIALWEGGFGDDGWCPYLIADFSTEEWDQVVVYLEKWEHRSILYYLASKGFIKIKDIKGEKDTVDIKFLPKPEPIIRLKTLELIARDLKDYYTGPEITALLKEAEVDERLIVYPQSKWLIFYGVFRELTLSKEKKDKDLLFKIIANALHPLNFAGDLKKSEELQAKFNKYLVYDELVVLYGDKEYSVCKTKDIVEVNEDDIFQAENEDAFVQEQDELNFLRQPKNKDKISALRKVYQAYINLVEVFCDNPSKPTSEFNDAYIKIKKLITDAIRDLHLDNGTNTNKKIHALAHYFIPFDNLFTAEKEYSPSSVEFDLTGKKLSWDYIRPRMNATYGCIDDLYRKVDGSDVLKPDVQQILDDVSLLVSKTKGGDKKKTETKQKLREERLHNQDSDDFLPKYHSAPIAIEDPDEEIRVIENRKKYELQFAKSLLERIEKIEVKNGFRPVSLCLGNSDTDNEAEKKIGYLTEKFYENLEKQDIIKSLKFSEDPIIDYDPTHPEECPTSSATMWYINFNTYPDKLIEHLKAYIKAGGLLQGKMTILFEPDYGFYREEKRDKVYPLTSKDKRSFKMILTLNQEGKKRASELEKIIGCKMNKISDMCKNINKQFDKRCGIKSDVIAYKNNFYEIGGQFLIKQA